MASRQDNPSGEEDDDQHGHNALFSATADAPSRQPVELPLRARRVARGVARVVALVWRARVCLTSCPLACVIGKRYAKQAKEKGMEKQKT